ncbi:MAG: hypothetical protein ACOYNP_10360 [Gemmataceae bacterium]|jgi:hypothetical protein|nr:hypothetical protein [Rhodospirillales bacterium]
MTWIDFAERLGLPAALLMVVLAAAGRACSWIGTEVVVPLRDRHLAFLDRTEQLLEGQEQSLGRLVELTERIDKRTEAQSRRVGG